MEIGFNAVERACYAGKALLIIAAEDISKSSRRKLDYLIKETGIQCVELGHKALFGESFNIRDVGILCVDDRNFVKGILRVLTEAEEL